MRLSLASLIIPFLTPAAVAAQLPKNIIVFVADGAGAGHWSVALHELGRPAVMDFPVIGLSDTRGWNHTVTESAASATAMFTGFRTVEGAIGLGPDSQPVASALEVAAEAGKATGIMTTTWVIDATPAALVAHAPSRYDAHAVLRDMLEQRPNVIFGGGRRGFNLLLGPDSAAFLPRFRSHYTVIETAEALEAVADTATMVLGLFAEEDLPLAGLRDPGLATMTRAALRILSRNPDGFFLMVEQEETDTQAHRNQPLDVIAPEMRAFDEAVRVGVEFQRASPETLILVLADHETGGMSLARGGDSLLVQYHTSDHTAEPVPIFASGPSAEKFAGFLANEEIGRRLVELAAGR